MSEAPDDRTRWRDLAVSRSVDPAGKAAEDAGPGVHRRRPRAARRPRRAATSPSRTSSTDPGSSLRSFYHHFAGKYELLLAVFEEGIRTTAHHLDQEVDRVRRPARAARVFITEYYRICRSGSSRGHSTSGCPAAASASSPTSCSSTTRRRPPTPSSRWCRSSDELLDDAAAAGEIQPGSTTSRWPGSSCRRSCSTPSPRRSPARPPTTLPGRGDLFWEVLLTASPGEVRSATDREEPDQPSRSDHRRVCALAACVPRFVRRRDERRSSISELSGPPPPLASTTVSTT